MTYYKLNNTELYNISKNIESLLDSAEEFEINDFGFLLYANLRCDSFMPNSVEIKKMIYNRIEEYKPFFGLDELSYSQFEGKLYFIFRERHYNIYIQNDEDVNASLMDEKEQPIKSVACILVQNGFAKEPINRPLVYISISNETKLMHVSDNFYPKVYYPIKDIVSLNNAINILLNDFVEINNPQTSHFNISTIKEEAKKVIFPLYFENKCEIRICWKLTLEHYSLCYYIDSQTGEIVNKSHYGWDI